MSPYLGAGSSITSSRVRAWARIRRPSRCLRQPRSSFYKKSTRKFSGALKHLTLTLKSSSSRTMARLTPLGGRYTLPGCEFVHTHILKHIPDSSNISCLCLCLSTWHRLVFAEARVKAFTVGHNTNGEEFKRRILAGIQSLYKGDTVPAPRIYRR